MYSTYNSYMFISENNNGHVVKRDECHITKCVLGMYINNGYKGKEML